MSVPVELPELGESVVEGTIARWLVKEGEQVQMDQPLVEVTTDKVDAEIPSPVAGVVEAILVAEGETVAVGTALAQVNPDGASATAPSRRPEISTPTPPAPPAGNGAGDPVRATPVARRMAEESGVELGNLSGSGIGGRVMSDDVRSASSGEERPATPRETSPPSPAVTASTPASSAPRSVPAASSPERGAKGRPFAAVDLAEGDRVVPMTPLRKLVAEHMVYSKRTSPHVGTVAEIDMGGVVAVRKANKQRFQEMHGAALTFLPFIVHATVRALREFPRLNASVIEDAIVEKKDLNLGIAVETEKGLVVPVVRNADRLSLSGLVTAIDDLSNRARSKRLSADDLKGGTFTVSNPGRNGNLYGFAIINQPQVGILRMGEIVKRPVVRSIDGADAIVIRPMMYLSLSYDHRAVDGAPANAFLYRVRELLEEADFDL